MKKRLLFVLGTLLLVLIMTACGETTTGGKAPAGSQQVQINETDFKIASSITTFSPGKAYHFTITNNGKTVHEFMIMPRSMGAIDGMSMGDMDKMALASVNDIQPGETKTLDYTFPSSTANSQPEFACYITGHYEAGMKQKVTVK